MEEEKESAFIMNTFLYKRDYDKPHLMVNKPAVLQVENMVGSKKSVRFVKELLQTSKTRG